MQRSTLVTMIRTQPETQTGAVGQALKAALSKSAAKQ